MEADLCHDSSAMDRFSDGSQRTSTQVPISRILEPPKYVLESSKYLPVEQLRLRLRWVISESLVHSFQRSGALQRALVHWLVRHFHPRHCLEPACGPTLPFRHCLEPARGRVLFNSIEGCSVSEATGRAPPRPSSGRLSKGVPRTRESCLDQMMRVSCPIRP